MWTAFLALTVLVPAATPSELAERTSKNHEVFPVTTKLQQALLGPGVNIFLVLNAQAIFDAGAPDKDNAELKRIGDILSQHKMARLIAHFRMFFGGGARDTEQYRKLASALTQVATKAGFKQAKTSGTWRNDDKTWNDVRPQIHRKGGEETPIGNKLVQAYPVQTSLSSYLTEDADCVVDILTTLKGDTPDALDDPTRKAIAEYVAKLELKSKRKVLFRVRTGKGGGAAFERFLSHSRSISDMLGFGSSSIRR